MLVVETINEPTNQLTNQPSHYIQGERVKEREREREIIIDQQLSNTLTHDSFYFETKDQDLDDDNHCKIEPVVFSFDLNVS